MKLKIKAYMSKEDFFNLPSAEQRKKLRSTMCTKST